MSATNVMSRTSTHLSDVNEIKKLIRLFRANECLWNPKSSGFNNWALKENTWLRLSCFFHNKLTVDQLKLQVLSLRYYFAKEQEKMKQCKLKGIKFVPRHSYYEDLKFLKEPVTKIVNEKSIMAPQKINYLVGNIDLLSSSQSSIQSEKVDFSHPFKSDKSLIKFKENRRTKLPQPPLQLNENAFGMRAASGNDTWHPVSKLNEQIDESDRRLENRPANSLSRSVSRHQSETGKDRSSYNPVPKKKVLTGKYRTPPKQTNAEDWQSNYDSRGQHVACDNHHAKSSREMSRKKSGEDTTNTQANKMGIDSGPFCPAYENGPTQLECHGSENYESPNRRFDNKTGKPPSQQLIKNDRREMEETQRGFENTNDQRYRRYPEDLDCECPAKTQERNFSNGRQMPLICSNDDRFYRPDPDSLRRRDYPARAEYKPPFRGEYRSAFKNGDATRSRMATTQAQEDYTCWVPKKLTRNNDTCPSDEQFEENIMCPSERDRKMRRMINEEFMQSLERRRRRNGACLRENPERKLCQNREEDSDDFNEERPVRYLGQNPKQPRNGQCSAFQIEFEEWQANQQLNDETNYKAMSCPKRHIQSPYGNNRDYYAQNDRPRRGPDLYSFPNNVDCRQWRQGFRKFDVCRRDDDYSDQERMQQRKIKNDPYCTRRRQDYANYQENGRERSAENEVSNSESLRDDIRRDFYKQSCSAKCSRVNSRSNHMYSKFPEDYQADPKDTKIDSPTNRRIEERQYESKENYEMQDPYNPETDLRSKNCQTDKADQIQKPQEEEHPSRNQSNICRGLASSNRIDQEICKRDETCDAIVKNVESVKPFNTEEKMLDCACPTDEDDLEAKNTGKHVDKAPTERCEVAVETDIDMTLHDRQRCECSDKYKRTNVNEPAKSSKNIKRIGKVCMCKPPVFNRSRQQKSSDPAGAKSDCLKHRSSTASGTKSRSLNRRQNKLEDDITNKFQALGGHPLKVMQEERLYDTYVTSQLSSCDKVQWGKNKSLYSHKTKQEVDGMKLQNRPIKFISRSCSCERNCEQYSSNPFSNLNSTASKRDVIILYPPVLGFRSSKHSSTETKFYKKDMRHQTGITQSEFILTI